MKNGLKSRNSRQQFLPAVLVLLFVLYLASTAVAAGQRYFKTWTTENGLPQNHVSYIAQTPDGYLWLATFDGLGQAGAFVRNVTVSISAELNHFRSQHHGFSNICIMSV